MKKTILITGASSGIGWSTAIKLDKKGHSLILCGRQLNKLQELSKKLNSNSHLLTFDVRNREDVFKCISSIPKQFKDVDVLINNAGNAHGLALAHQSNISDWEAMIDGNVKGVLYVTKAILDGMVEKKSGQIINVGSIAGKESYPKGNVYCASKAAVEKFTEGLRLDLNPFNIRVGAIHPGLVETNFSNIRFKGDKDKAKKVYKGYTPLSAEDVADAICYMIGAPKHVNIADLTILPTDQAGAYVLKKSI
jgi:NADP-dependent 3-hydroxy acid dehydrogenase YdfG